MSGQTPSPASHTTFSHFVQIDEATRTLTIYRVFPGGETQFYTETELTPVAPNLNDAVFAQFARTLGENILLDSPATRRAMGI